MEDVACPGHLAYLAQIAEREQREARLNTNGTNFSRLPNQAIHST